MLDCWGYWYSLTREKNSTRICSALYNKFGEFGAHPVMGCALCHLWKMSYEAMTFNIIESLHIVDYNNSTAFMKFNKHNVRVQ